MPPPPPFGAVYAAYFADPFVWQSEGRYYAIGTGRDEAVGAADQRSRAVASVFPLLQSTDLRHWQPAGHALIPPEAIHGQTYWAPEIAFADGLWYLYYSVGHGDSRHQLRVAVSERVLGPYRDLAQLTDPDQIAFAIDPHPFRDDDGRWYLFHARDFLSTEDETGAAVHAGTALVVSELTSMTSLGPLTHTVLRARSDWQLYAAQRAMYGQVFDWHTLEGPSVIKEGGRYYCFYSGGCWQNETYGVDYAVAEHVMGPYHTLEKASHPRMLRTDPLGEIGPGHCSILTVAESQQRWMIYHAWDPQMTARRMHVASLAFDGQNPQLERWPG